jgi:hypothetical protein
MNDLPFSMLTPDRIDRRAVLKGVSLGAGAVVLQPFLNSLAAQAAGQAPPARIVFFMEQNGLWPDNIQPKGVDLNAKNKDLIDRPLADLELPDPIAPLAPFKDRMAIIQKLSHKISGAGDHSKNFGGLGCYNWRKGPAGQTVDHAFAAAQSSIIPVVGLGVPAAAGSVFMTNTSAIAAKKPLSLICSPQIAFQTLFGSVAEGDAARVFNSKNRLLDWIRSDVRRVRDALPAMDREKLDSYLDAFDQMRVRQDKIATIKDRLKANEPATDKFKSDKNTDRFEAQCAIAAAALAGGLTNVVTIDASCSHSYHLWKALGVEKEGHWIGHQEGTPDAIRDTAIIRRFHAERVAQMAQRLDSIKEGNGTMLDNTLIVWMSDSGERHHGFCSEWPLVLVGGLGDRIKTAGRFLQYPAYGTAGNRTIRNFYLALLHAVGVKGEEAEKFGELDREMPKDAQAGPLAEILA